MGGVNRLGAATSPYLLQHAGNPVDWWEWGEDAFEEARRRDVPILLSVGYSSCHWCHVMAHESFEDDATAAYLNEHFVNVRSSDGRRWTRIPRLFVSLLRITRGALRVPLEEARSSRMAPVLGAGNRHLRERRGAPSRYVLHICNARLDWLHGPC